MQHNTNPLDIILVRSAISEFYYRIQNHPFLIEDGSLHFPSVESDGSLPPLLTEEEHWRLVQLDIMFRDAYTRHDIQYPANYDYDHFWPPTVFRRRQKKKLRAKLNKSLRVIFEKRLRRYKRSRRRSRVLRRFVKAHLEKTVYYPIQLVIKDKLRKYTVRQIFDVVGYATYDAFACECEGSSIRDDCYHCAMLCYYIDTQRLRLDNVSSRVLFRFYIPDMWKDSYYLQSGDILYYDPLKPNANHSKYNSKLTKAKINQSVEKKFNSINWNGSSLEDIHFEKFIRANELSKKASKDLAKERVRRNEKKLKRIAERSRRGPKHEFKFNQDGTVEFQGFNTLDIPQYVLDFIVAITSMACNPTATSIISTLYFICRVYVPHITLTTMYDFFTACYYKYLHKVPQTQAKKLRDKVSDDDKVGKSYIDDYVEYCQCSLSVPFPVYPGLEVPTIREHVKKWTEFRNKNRAMFLDVAYENSYPEHHLNLKFSPELDYLHELFKDKSYEQFVDLIDAYFSILKIDILYDLTPKQYYVWIISDNWKEYELPRPYRLSLTRIKSNNWSKVSVMPLAMKPWIKDEDELELSDLDAQFQGPDLKMDVFDNFTKMALNKDSMVFEDSEFGRSSRRMMSTLTLAPFILMTGGISSLDKYDQWYSSKFGVADMALSTISSVGTWVYHFLKTGLPYLISGDSIFLNPVYDYERWIELSSRVIDEINDKPTLQKLAGEHSYDEACTLISALSKTGRDLAKAAKGISLVASKIASLMMKLSQCYVVLRNHYKSKRIRAQPLGIMIYGLPGAGKSSVVHSLTAIIASNLGCIAKHNVFNVNPATKHLDGYKEEPIGVIDDVGSSDPKVAPDEIIARLCTICSEFTITTPQAELADKGNINYNFSALIATTNFPDANFRLYLKNPAAAMRRFEVYIEVTLDEKYLQPGSTSQVRQDLGRIDITKLQKYSVFRPLVISNVESSYDFHKFEGQDLHNVNYDTLCRFIHSYHKEYMSRADSAREDTTNLLSAVWCEAHSCLNTFCDCGKTIAEPPLRDMYQFEEVVDVEKFDFRKFKFTEESPCLSRSLIAALYTPDIADNAKPGFFDNLNKAKEMQRIKRQMRGGVNADLQGWFSSKVKSVLMAPVKGCVTAVMRDEDIRREIGLNINNEANNIVNILTQEEQLNTIGNNVANSNITSVSTLIKKFRDSMYSETVKILGITAASLVGFFILYKCFRMFYKYITSTKVKEFQFSGNFPDRNNSEYMRSYKETDAQIIALDNPTPPHPVTRPAGLAPLPISLKRLQNNQIVPFSTLIKDNIVEFFVKHGNNMYSRCSGIVLGRNIVFTTWHTFKEVFKSMNAVNLKVVLRNSVFSLSLSEKDVCVFEGRDLCAFSHGGVASKKITRILPKSDTELFKSKCAFYRSETDIDKNDSRAEVKVSDAYYTGDTINFAHKDKDVYPYATYHSVEETVRGDCGLPIAAIGDFSCLVGIHAGVTLDTPSILNKNKNMAFMVRIYPDDLEKAAEMILKNSSRVTPLSLPETGRPIGLESFELQGFNEGSFATHIKGFVYPIGWVKNKSTLRSKIRKSIIYEDLHIRKYKIPEFSSIVTTDPKGVLQYINPVLTKFRAIEDSPRMINPLLLNKAKTILSAIMDSWCDWNDIRPASFHDILNGKPGTISGAVNLSTAPGPAYSVHLKRDLVLEGELPNNRICDEELYFTVFQAFKAYFNRETAGFVSMWFPKDEPITFEKEGNGRQRYVSLSPFDKLVISKMVLKNVFLAIRMSGKGHMAVGVNAADPKQWGKFPEKFQKVDPKLERLVDGDYKFYDAYIWFVTLILGIIINKLRNNKWYNMLIRFHYKGDFVDLTFLQILECISADVSQYFVLVDGILVYVVNLTESGAEATAEINSVMESFLHILIYILCYINENIEKSDYELTFEQAVLGLPDFEEEVKLLNYGDDNVDSCSQEVVYFYNPKSRGKAAKSLGFPITDARKNPELNFVELKDVVFLKRSFRFDEEFRCYMAPLDEESIKKMMAFVKGNSNTLECLTTNNVCDAQLQYFMYGRLIFNERSDYLYELLKKHELTRYVRAWPTFDELVEKYLSGILQMGGL